jgi:hypothetical protein
LTVERKDYAEADAITTTKPRWQETSTEQKVEALRERAEQLDRAMEFELARLGA